MRILPVLAAATLSSTLIAAPASAHSPVLGPTAYGYGGGIATVDATATGAGLDVLRHGGNAIDAAVAAAVTLGVTEPWVGGPARRGGPR
jgi:gamma-glutamyltranspeptidase/glutathione hydrolase